MRHRVLITGAGLSGLTIGYLLRKKNWEVYLVEKSLKIGGLCRIRKRGSIRIQEFGAHIFHTNNREVWDFIRSLCPISRYLHRAKILTSDGLFEWPPVISEVHSFIGTVGSSESSESLEADVCRRYGKKFYDVFIRSYTRKSWDREGSQLPQEISRRFGLHKTRKFFSDSYQGVPFFDLLFERLSENLIILVNREHYLSLLNDIKPDLLIVTSPIDEFFDYRYGPLEFIGRSFKHICLNYPIWDPSIGVLNVGIDDSEIIRIYNNNVLYSRNTLPYYLTIERFGSGRFYPIPTRENLETRSKYLDLSRKLKKVRFLGRLGTYRYLNMDQCILEAMNLANKL